jgi:hypothetical protein
MGLPTRAVTLKALLGMILLVGGFLALMRLQNSSPFHSSRSAAFGNAVPMAPASPSADGTSAGVDQPLERPPVSVTETDLATKTEAMNSVTPTRGSLLTKDSWAEKHDRESLAELIKQRDEMRDLLYEQTQPEFEKRFERGEATFISINKDYDVIPEDYSELTSIRMIPGKGTFRTVLPRSEFPGLYEFKAQVDWYTDLIRQKSTH